MSNYTLTYFNVEGRAELIRWCFAFGGIQFTDERIHREDWTERKKTLPGGQVPVLFIDDQPLHQSTAITRYVAREAGLVPEDNLTAALCDAAVETVEDLRTQYYKILQPGKLREWLSEAEKSDIERQITEDFFPNRLTPILAKFNQRLQSRGWFYTEKCTWVDIAICCFLSNLRAHYQTVMKGFPFVESHVNKVLSLKNINNWVQNRPETEY